MKEDQTAPEIIADICRDLSPVSNPMTVLRHLVVASRRRVRSSRGHAWNLGQPAGWDTKYKKSNLSRIRIEAEQILMQRNSPNISLHHAMMFAILQVRDGRGLELSAADLLESELRAR